MSLRKEVPRNPPGRPRDPSLRRELAQLRSRAEQKAGAIKPRDIGAGWPVEARRVLHELRVHQVELEMQNEELRATRDQLEASRLRYFDLYDRAPVGYFTLSEEGLIVEANLTAAGMLGVARGTLPGQRLSRFILNDDEDIYYFLTRNLRNTGQPQTCELRMAKPDASPFWVRLDAAPGPVEGASWLAVIGDITQRIRTEEALRESREHLLSAERLAHVGHWHWDLLTGMFTVSEEVLRILGRPPGYKPAYKEFIQALVPASRGLVENAIRNCIADHRGRSVEFQIARPDGELRTLTSTLEVLLNERSLPGRLFGICQDVTDARRAQEESFTRQRLESVGTLAGGIAHDFNNLLGGVMAQAELALEGYQAGSSPEEQLMCIREGAIRGSQIVRQLMIYAGKETEAAGLADVSQVARDMLELFKVSVSKHALLETDFGSDLPAVRASVGQIQQIVMNLVTNASEALEDRDGSIRVATRCLSAGRAEAASKGIPEGDYVQIEVADTGRGMSRETQARAFEPFFTTKPQGHGLGLGVVSGIVRGLGGAIHLVSEEGKGTLFQIFLPSAGIAVVAAADLLPSVQDPGQERVGTILLVEDDDALRSALAQILRRRGFETLVAANGSDAIALLRAQNTKIDAMLLDMTIPGASSRDVAAAAEARPGMKLVLTSAYDEKLVRTTVAAALPCAFIRKPFQVEELVEALRRLLSARVTHA